MLCFVSLRKGITEREGREDASRELRPRRKAGVKDTPRVDHLPGQDEGMTSNSLPHEHCRGVLDAAILSTEENSCIPHYCEMQEELCHAEKPVKEGIYPDNPYVSPALGQHILSPVPDLRRSWFAQVPVFTNRCHYYSIFNGHCEFSPVLPSPNAALALSNKNRMKRLDKAKGRLMAFYQKQWQKANRKAREHIRDKMVSVSSGYQSRLSVLERVLVHMIADMEKTPNPEAASSDLWRELEAAYPEREHQRTVLKSRVEKLSHDPSTGLTLFKGEPAEVAYNKQMKDQFMKLIKRVSNAVRKSAASLHKDGFDDYAQEMRMIREESCFMVDTVHYQWRKWAEAITICF